MKVGRTHLFAYGTLKPGFPNYRHIQQHVHACLPGVIDGVPVDLGSFPALVPGTGIVRGVVLEIDDEALTITDHIEGCDPDEKRSLYLRKKVSVRLTAGSTLTAWVYGVRVCLAKRYCRLSSAGSRP